MKWEDEDAVMEVVVGDLLVAHSNLAEWEEDISGEEDGEIGVCCSLDGQLSSDQVGLLLEVIWNLNSISHPRVCL